MKIFKKKKSIVEYIVKCLKNNIDKKDIISQLKKLLLTDFSINYNNILGMGFNYKYKNELDINLIYKDFIKENPISLQKVEKDLKNSGVKEEDLKLKAYEFYKNDGILKPFSYYQQLKFGNESEMLDFGIKLKIKDVKGIYFL